jgi:hypothetical protein
MTADPDATVVTRLSPRFLLIALAFATGAMCAGGCGTDGSVTGDGGGGTGPAGASGAAGRGGAGGAAATGVAGAGGRDAAGTTGTAGTTGAAGTNGAGGSTGAGGTGGTMPAGWLYTSGNKVYLSSGNGAGTVWVGRGVNTDDIYLCGYNDTLWMTSPDQTLETVVAGIISGWKPTFLRLSLSMDSYPTVSSWLGTNAPYKTAMTNVIDAIGTHAGVYVLVTLRSDASMILQDTTDGDTEATGVPSDSTTTPNAASFPTGTDAVYVALVDSFASSSFVLFGLTNEPGGNQRSDSALSAAMSHAVGVIRAEEDRLGVPHHLVSVQGNGWTGDISFYATTPLPYDNVIYEIHGYPPTTGSYTYSNIPVIIGEYGTLDSGSAPAFFADVESKEIPTLAWDLDPFSDCAPDLVTVDQSATGLAPSAWGTLVQNYLLMHAP